MSQAGYLDEGRQLGFNPGLAGKHAVLHDERASQDTQHDEVWTHIVQGKVGVRQGKGCCNGRVIGAEEHESQS